MVTSRSDPAVWLRSVRASHGRLTATVDGLDPSDLDRPSLWGQWSIAQVLSHLGSQAEIFSLLVDAGVDGTDPPSQEAFAPIWDAWNSRSARDQATDSITANEALVSRLEGLDSEALGTFHLEAFGMDLDAAGLLRLRLSEHALHAWDVAAALDPAARVTPDAVELLLEGLPGLAARVGKPTPHSSTVAITTTDPRRRFLLAPDGVRLEPTNEPTGTAIAGSISLTAETLVRLVYGRLQETDAVHVERGISLEELPAVFPGF